MQGRSRPALAQNPGSARRSRPWHRHAGRARRPGPALPRPRPLTRVPSAAPGLGFGPQALIKQARVTFPLIPPQVRGKLEGMQIQGSAGEVRAAGRRGGAPVSSQPGVPITPKLFWSRGGEGGGGGGGRGGTSVGRPAQDLEVMHNSTAQLSGPPLSWEWEFAPNFVYGTVREPRRPRCLLLLRRLLGERTRLRPAWGM